MVGIQDVSVFLFLKDHFYHFPNIAQGFVHSPSLAVAAFKKGTFDHVESVFMIFLDENRDLRIWAFGSGCTDNPRHTLMVFFAWVKSNRALPPAANEACDLLLEVSNFIEQFRFGGPMVFDGGHRKRSAAFFATSRALVASARPDWYSFRRFCASRAQRRSASS